ncbi:MAG: UDP-3-O-(3-hydroxymyristoyl)glucosamine N-acyltransferase [Candidatus Eisenbacteria bacterium]|uniref:UDP-3-O-acylglucosamine N-acyltransferase n=1 Tax=Eiseniibacteriota bacterium TaxID=2212470 RepID=A0A538SP48_UNCEI|nr:MAG: UDP-3-O-(3-hydroxymyristoyl)glucosamine N-acyltransferase [Candidatus Eisenbacteria bacterium]TMQ62637.1 MAG: UDP-3-O-(3-hydroxymyristoyl)glucosamine N-acyltransferase [Candidatus Eisenbacteria bacterium]
MKVTLEAVAKAIDGTVVGDGSVEITGVAGIREAREGDLTFLANPRYESYLDQTQASAIIVSENHRSIGKPLIQNPNPYLAFLKAIRLFAGEAERPCAGVHPTAVVSEEAYVAQDASIGPYVVIERGASIGARAIVHAGCYVGARARLGDEILLYPNVTVREECVLGDRVIVHSGTVVGSDGFGFVRDGDVYRKLPQVGNVVVEDDVEIGANVTIDRATTGTTRIGAGSKIDNLVQIAHNVQVGENCIIVAQVGISGSTVLGDHVVLAGQVGIVGHIEIGDGASVGAQSGVSKSVKAGERMFGYPAMPLRQAKRIEASIRNLPELIQTVRRLKRRVDELEGSKEPR